MKQKTHPSSIQITTDEYPPKWIGTKRNGDKKMVYRLDENNCEVGLVFHTYNHNIAEYHWEYFDLIQKYK